MTRRIVFKKRVLDFINVIQEVSKCYGLEQLHKTHTNCLPPWRTLCEWFRILRGKLDYYPYPDFLQLGLVHAHLILTEPDEDWLRFPFALEISWILPLSCKKTLHLHCLVPSKHEDNFVKLVHELTDKGLCEECEISFYGNGRQYLKKLSRIIDRDGNIISNHKIRLFKDMFENQQILARDIKCFPFLIPVLFENYGHWMSLNGLWKKISDRLGNDVKGYLPNGFKHFEKNGKMHVKYAYSIINSFELLRQYFIRYRALHKLAQELFLFVDLDDERFLQFVQVVVNESIVIEVYRGFENCKGFIRAIGDSSLIDAINTIRYEENIEFSLAFLNKSKTWNCDRARFQYELLFNPKKCEWVFPYEKILTLMGVDECE